MLKTQFAPQPENVGDQSNESDGRGSAPHCGHRKKDTKYFLWKIVDVDELDRDRSLEEQLRELWSDYSEGGAS